MRISYHELKRTETLKHRGLDFALAGRVFLGPTLTVEDDRRDYGEPRFQTIGRLGPRVVMVVWTPRGDFRHIISMRDCNVRERERHQKQLDRPG